MDIMIYYNKNTKLYYNNSDIYNSPPATVIAVNYNHTKVVKCLFIQCSLRIG